ncbi:MAG TPA: PHP domain-containing protein [Verrucomicrobiae bacterium]
MFADLHLHTSFSDGTYSPEELTMEGKRFNLSVLSLTDHDTMEGCERMAAACSKQGIEFVPGSELTAEQDDYELHLLGYYLDTSNVKLTTALAAFQAARQERIREMVERIKKLGIPIEPEDVFRIASCQSPGRPHVGRVLVEKGVCKTMDEAFERFLKKGRAGWVPKFRISAPDAIKLIHQSGGVAVMAHPGLNRSDDMIPELVEAGMDGIECFHTKHSTAVSQHYLMMAEQKDLLITGGSDCHGMNKGKPLIGSIRLPYSNVVKLRERAALNKARYGQPPANPSVN